MTRKRGTNDPSAQEARVGGPGAARLLGRVTAWAGWVSFVLIVLGLGLENFPGLERWLARAAQDRIGGALTSSVEIEDIDVMWLERSIRLRGVAMGPTGRELVADEITLLLGLSGGPRVERLTVRGGELTVTEELASPIEAGAAQDEELSPLEFLSKSPGVVVRDFDLRITREDGTPTLLGTVDLSMSRTSGDDARIVGRFAPAVGVASDPAGVVWLEGALEGGRTVELRGVARALSVDLDRLAASAPGEALRKRGRSPVATAAAFDPEGRVDLVAEATYEVGSSILPSLTARAAIAGGSLALPWLASSGSRRVRDVELSAEIEFSPTREDPLGRAAWSARGIVDAAWQDLELASGFRMGRFAPEGLVFDAWASLPEAPLGDDLGELTGGEKGIKEVERMLRPKGRASVSIGARLTEANAVRDDMRVDRLFERFVSIRPRGEAALAYHGSINPETGQLEFGFPLPVTGADGDVTWSIRPTPGTPYEGQLGIYDAVARHAEGPVLVQGSLHFIPSWQFGSPELARLVPMPFHLLVESEDLPVDGDFRRAMEGLYDAPGMREILPTWNPSGGRIDFGLELWRTADRREMSLALDAQLSDVGARWVELAVPVSGVTGALKVRNDGGGPMRGRGLVALDLEARTSAASQPLRVAGRIESEGRDRSLAWFEVDARGVNPRSSELRGELGRKNPEALDALEEAGIAEFLDAHVTAVQAIPMREARAMREAAADGRHAYAGGMATWLDLEPSSERAGIRLQPRKFNVVTREAHGHVHITTALPPRPPGPARAGAPPLPDPEEDLPSLPSTAIRGRVQGLWRQTGPSVPVTATIEAGPDGATRIEAVGAGLDIANDALIGALISAAREASRAGQGSADPVDTDLLDVTGRVDFEAAFTLPTEAGGELTDTSFGVEARLDRLAIGGSQVLEDVSAHLRFIDASDEWIGEEVRGRLGSTPVLMRDVSWSPTEGGSVFRTRIDARGLPIDEEHLSFFLDPQTRRLVLDDLGARGRFDLEGTELELVQSDLEGMAVHLNGRLAVEDAFVDLGVPIELTSVEALDLDLTHEGRGLRARAALSGTNGSIAGRSLADASFGLTYVEPRLVIESLEGRFEGGMLRAIGGRSSEGANLFSIDLAPPFPFELSAELEDVDIGAFLRGVFDSDFANRGRMDLDVRLAGDFEHLTDMRGGGSIRVEESALWAIPVFQALSTRLGIDTTVLFRTMLCDYAIADGELRLERMRVDSDLLSLVGEGAISFEGDVVSDLEVRYGLVDSLGPLTKLLYHIQNSLLRVSIRGSMERPTVVLRGLVSQFFSPDEERERLPLPGFSQRRKRF